ncbi:PREDICTED: uncharacterized protein LOC105146151 [Acromyrmex echinatior]|uniref:uncharacterized protein LOC105146151 n=1 Tax=Acromyrmex echinatior TaxID=103372 RepID=UPI000580F345|nr:PREDICTED: uncharacterized protein LOC105146151 [Acromyrmex echinatior]
MRKDVYDKVKLDKLRGNSIYLTDFGKNEVHSLGCIITIVEGDADEYPCIVHIVPNEATNSSVIIGSDFLATTEMTVNNDRITIRRATPAQLLTQTNVIEKQPLDIGNVTDTKVREEVETIVETYQTVLTQNPVLKIYHSRYETEVHMDASINGYGLLQRSDEDNLLHPVYFMSKKTKKEERNYTSYELKALTIVEALRKFRVYLLGIQFKIITDCVFQRTMSKKELSTSIAKWALEDYVYVIEHRTCMKHVDALNRHPVMTIAKSPIIPQIRSQQASDEEIQAIIEIAKDKPNKVERHIANCVQCILTNHKEDRQEGYLHPIPKSDVPLHTYHIDHLGPLDTTNKSYNHILTIIDNFTKFVRLYPTKSTTAREVTSRLDVQKQIFGNPKQIVTDRDTAFTSQEFKEYCQREGIEHVTVTTGLPRANGQVERLNRAIILILCKLSIEEPAKWYKHVDKLQRILNSTFNRNVNETPFDLLFGIKMRDETDLKLHEVIEQEFRSKFEEERNEIRARAKEQILKVQSENRKTYNFRHKKATECSPPGGRPSSNQTNTIRTKPKIRSKIFRIISN